MAEFSPAPPVSATPAAAAGAQTPAGPVPPAAAPGAPAATSTSLPAATTPLAWALLLVLAAIWGTSFILMKRGLVVFSGLEVGLTRVSVAALLLLPFALRQIGQVERSRFKYLALSGTVGTLVPAVLFAYAETRLASGLAGVLNALTVGFTLLIGALFFEQQLTRLRVLGIALGLAGTVVLMQLGGSGSGPAATATPGGAAGNAWYGLFIVAATLGYGLSVNVIKRHLTGLAPLTMTAVMLLLVGGPALAGLLLGTDFLAKLAAAPGAWTAFGYVALLATLSTAVAMVLFNRLIQQSTALFAASSTYLIPLVALAWGGLDGEAFNAWHAAGMVIILAGVYIIHRAK